jgi:hypothetical protein
VRQPSLFDDMRQTQRRKYNEVLATGKAVVVLAVARGLKQPFRLNDLSVACWRQDPDFFGMKGYPQFPDNHKIHTFLYGKRGLIARGQIDRVSEGLFEVRPSLPALLPGEGRGQG